jgi:hypothetical protein
MGGGGGMCERGRVRERNCTALLACAEGNCAALLERERRRERERERDR